MQRKVPMIMFESRNDNINPPKVNYVTVEIRKTKIDDAGNIYEVVEEQQVPDFVASILLNNGNAFVDKIN